MLRRRLLAVLGGSVALGDHLVAHPEDWQALRPPAEELGDSRPVGPGSAAPAARCRGCARQTDAVPRLRRAYRTALVALAARDLAGELAVEDVAGELADLAGATFTAALASLAGADPGGAGFRLAVIGLGKCGGRELNYVSDVDVVFVAEPRGWHRRGRRPAGGDRRCAARRWQVCAQVAWPVDAALRPEGKSGPLVRTLASHLAYYQRWAKTWEFQALLKARPIAGDLQLGKDYVEALSPLVWSAGERPGFVEDVQAMRRRVEETLKGDTAEREVKLGPGGLRDVEFSVQLLQLVHGRTDDTDPLRHHPGRAGPARAPVATSDARTRATWPRPTAGCAPSSTGCSCTGCAAPTCCHPRTTSRPCAQLARAIGLRGDVLPLFRQQRYGHFREVRRLHEKLFYRPLLAAVARLPAAEARLTPQAARERLEALGFDDPANALRHLEALTEGVSRRAAIQQTLLPAMLGWFADAADPDAGLLSFRQVSDALGTTPWYLRLLRDEGTAAERLARLLASSRYVADLFGRAPDAVALLASDEDLVPRSHDELERRLPGGGAASGRLGGRPRSRSAACAARSCCASPAPSCSTTTSLPARRCPTSPRSRSPRHWRSPPARSRPRRRGELPMRLAVIAMGRLGGSRAGLRLRRRRAVRARAGRRGARRARPLRPPTTSPTSCGGCSRSRRPIRRCSSMPICGPRGGRGR